MSLRGKTVDDPRDQWWIDTIAEQGHAIMSVSDGVDEPTGEPGFTYSVGAFESYGAPELIVFGLHNDLAVAVINHAMDEFVAGRRFSCGVPEMGLLGGGFPVVLLEADPAKGKEHACFADWYYERQPFPLWQIVWPGKTVGFPWEPRCTADVIEQQPDLTPGSDWGGLRA